MQNTNLSGQQIGAYRLEEIIGVGGMGVVYRARQRQSNQVVAVKVLAGGLSQMPEYAQRFRREIATVIRLRHPHVVPIIDHGEQYQMLYLVMRYFSGGTLNQRLQQMSQPSWGDTARIMQQITSALQHAHAHGIIHRDIKPGNILFDTNRNAYLGDFGIARIAQMAQLTRPGDNPGTPVYMAPEQWLDQPIDHRVDIYALGMILYQMLTGQLPFQARSEYGWMRHHVETQPRPPSSLRPELPAALDSAVLKALNKDPRNRQHQATDLYNDFIRSIRQTSQYTSQAQVTRFLSNLPGLPGKVSTPRRPSGTRFHYGSMPGNIATPDSQRQTAITATIALVTIVLLASLLLILLASSGQNRNDSPGVLPTTPSQTQAISPSNTRITATPTVRSVIPIPTTPFPSTLIFPSQSPTITLAPTNIRQSSPTRVRPTATEVSMLDFNTITYGEVTTSEGDTWYFYGGDQVIVVIDVRSNYIDPYVELWSPENQRLARDDDSGPGVSALIPHFALPKAGTYKLITRSANNSRGRYRVEVRRSNACTSASVLMPRLTTDARAYILPDPPLANILRNGFGYDKSRIGRIVINEEFTVLEGPVCADDVNWWRVRLNNGQTGWTVEGSDYRYISLVD